MNGKIDTTLSNLSDLTTSVQTILEKVALLEQISYGDHNPGSQGGGRRRTRRKNRA
jgi:hypothetical protein